MSHMLYDALTVVVPNAFIQYFPLGDNMVKN